MFKLSQRITSFRKNAAVAQSGERHSVTVEVVGSKPISCAITLHRFESDTSRQILAHLNGDHLSAERDRHVHVTIQTVTAIFRVYLMSNQLDLFPSDILLLEEKMKRFIKLKRELESYGGRGFSTYPLEFRIEALHLKQEILKDLQSIQD